MREEDPFKVSKLGLSRTRSLREQLISTSKRPYIGVTQGGSSRENSGCKSAASYGRKRANKAGADYE